MSSIYQIVHELGKIFSVNYVFNPIVAYNKETGQPYMLLPEHDKENLQSLVSTNDNVIVNYMYWDYKFCDKNNISEKDKDYLLRNVSKDYYIRDDVAQGSLLVLIACFNILLQTYIISDKKLYIKLLDSINIDKGILVDFLIETKINLPINDNFNYLLKKVFSFENENPKILNFLFKNEMYYTADQIENILSEIDFGGLNEAAVFFVFNNNTYSQEQKLFYTKALIKAYDDIIDTVPTLYLDAKNYKPFLGYHLFSMKVNNNLVKLFYEVIELFFANGGAREIRFYNHEELDKFFIERSKYINEMVKD